MQISRVALFSEGLPSLNMRAHIKVPQQFCDGLVKCRVVYGEEIEEITYHSYKQKDIHSLKMVADDSIDYGYKYLDRNHINALYSQRGDCDDIIVVKDGMLTDSSYSNLALLRDGIWYTPSSCLLRGTRRQQLIDQGRIIVADISIDDIMQYEKVSLVNAMIGLGSIQIDVKNCH